MYRQFANGIVRRHLDIRYRRKRGRRSFEQIVAEGLQRILIECLQPEQCHLDRKIAKIRIGAQAPGCFLRGQPGRNDGSPGTGYPEAVESVRIALQYQLTHPIRFFPVRDKLSRG